MEIIVGKTSGFCYGVRRAVDGVTKEALETKGKIYCLGEIVHNKQVIQKLEKLGVKFIKTLEEAKETVLIRAHGIPKEIYQLAQNMNLKLHDYTCPKVLKVHEIAKKYKEEGYFIFLLGPKSHPENIGTLSYCGSAFYIFEKAEEIPKAIKAFEASNKKKLLLMSQTTFKLDRFYQIEKMLVEQLKRNITFVVQNTICKTIELRQKETEELAKKVDMMIVIGGKNSFNTKNLYESAKRYCIHTVLIETTRDLQREKIDERIGIIAGASTPQESIDDVVAYLEKKKP